MKSTAQEIRLVVWKLRWFTAHLSYYIAISNIGIG